MRVLRFKLVLLQLVASWLLSASIQVVCVRNFLPAGVFDDAHTLWNKHARHIICIRPCSISFAAGVFD